MYLHGRHWRVEEILVEMSAATVVDFFFRIFDIHSLEDDLMASE